MPFRYIWKEYKHVAYWLGMGLGVGWLWCTYARTGMPAAHPFKAGPAPAWPTCTSLEYAPSTAAAGNQPGAQEA